MKLGDALTGGLTLAFGLAVAAYAQTFPPMPGQSVGPGLLPTIVGVVLAVLGGVLLTWGLRQRDAVLVEVADWARSPRKIGNVALLVGDLVFYILAVDALGFFITGFLFLAVLLAAFGASRRWIAPIAALVTVAIHYGFYTLLHVPLPWGMLEGMAW